MATPRNSFWNIFVQAFDLLILARVPLLLVLAGAVMVYYVPQFQELFDLALDRPAWALWTWFFTGGLSLAAWYSARTLFSFEWPLRVQIQGVQKMLGKVLPRILAGLLPLIMALAFSVAVSADAGAMKWLWVLLFLLQGIALVLFTIYRRTLIQRALSGPMGRKFGAGHVHIEAKPSVGRLERWSDLGRARYIHVIGVIALVASWIVGYFLPHWIDLIGSPGLILGAFAMLVWASTAPVYLAARRRIPLVTALVAWATLMTFLGFNDNHAVRLTAQADSDQDPPAGLVYSNGARQPLSTFMAEWWDAERQRHCEGQVYFVSSEGGGIRAALWTVLVLSELQRETDGRFWDCTMAVSGVSGGSLGLASFAAFMRERDDDLAAGDNPLVTFLEDDFLAPVLGSMFGGDLFQRFLPLRLFTDRGQALERAWEFGFHRHVSDAPSPSSAASGLATSLTDSARSLDDSRWRTALFLNTTLVDSGLRLIQHPFSSLGAERDVSAPFPGAEDGARWLPEELPLFSAAHNSARFTFVSPAGTILRRENDSVRRLGQVVDGGYFENSGTTTIQALINGYEEVAAAAGGPSRFRAVHISNGETVEAFAPNGADRCPVEPPGPASAPLFGELRAPLIAILRTRDARGQFARQALLDRVQQATNGELWHYRLCAGLRSIPLGWTIGAQTTEEMRRQLACDPTRPESDCRRSAAMGRNTREIAAQWMQP